MSLKAKLEAVIYAAEEPVTLNQLAAIFAADALEWKAEQEAARAAEAADGDPTPLLTDEAAENAPENADDETREEVQDSAEEAAETQAESTEQLELTAGEDESELKRQARLRDREVKTILRRQLDEIIARYASDDFGVEVREIAGGFRMATKPECHDAVRLFVKSLKPPMKLSLAALETLAVIAYKQPVTAPEVGEIRGVESAGVLGSLLARKLIATAGRKQVIGRPILYKTTKEFLLRFGLKDISELPSMEEFEKMAAIELEEPEPNADDADEMTPEAAAQLHPEDVEKEPVETEQNDENPPIEPMESSAEPAATEEVPVEAEAEEATPQPEAVNEEQTETAE